MWRLLTLTQWAGAWTRLSHLGDRVTPVPQQRTERVPVQTQSVWGSRSFRKKDSNSTQMFTEYVSSINVSNQRDKNDTLILEITNPMHLCWSFITHLPQQNMFLWIVMSKADRQTNNRMISFISDSDLGHWILWLKNSWEGQKSIHKYHFIDWFAFFLEV